MSIGLQERNGTEEGGVGDALASCLVCSSLDQAVQVCVLEGDIVLCSWARHLSHSLHQGL